MATITFAASTFTKSKTISAADTQRWLDAYKSLYGPVSDGAGGTRPRTNQEVFDLVADTVFRGLQEGVRNIEGDVAKAAVAPIVIS